MIIFVVGSQIGSKHIFKMYFICIYMCVLCVCIFPISSHNVFKRHVFKNWDVIKWVIFTACFYQVILKWNRHPPATPPLQVCEYKEYKDLWYILVPLPWFMLSFIHHCFCSFSANVNKMKKTNYVLVELWKWFWH